MWAVTVQAIGVELSKPFGAQTLSQPTTGAELGAMTFNVCSAEF